MSKRAIVTGVLGQDGSYLAEYLIELGYDVYGVYKRVSTDNNFENIRSVAGHPRFHLLDGDITDSGFLNKLVSELQPDEYYGLAAQSHVGYSFKNPVLTFDVDARAVLLQLEAIRQFSPTTKFYNAATSEMFGGLHCPVEGYHEESELYPRSPYGIAKVAAFHSVRNYREAYGLFGCSGILFNHSSPRRGKDFATRKITLGVAAIKKGLATKIKMGNLDAFRDEGHSKDYVKAMHLILQQKKPADFIVATGIGASIKEMLQHVCTEAGLNFEEVYEQDPAFMRPSEVHRLLGDPEKIQSLGWKPEYNWRQLLTEMYKNDLEKL